MKQLAMVGMAEVEEGEEFVPDGVIKDGYTLDGKHFLENSCKELPF